MAGRNSRISASTPSTARSATPTIGAEAKVLLFCARPSPTQEDIAQVRHILANGIDWGYLLLAGHRQLLLSSLHARLSQHAGDLLPGDIATQLQSQSQANRRRWLAGQSELEATLEALQDASIPVVTLRLPAVTRYYDDSGERETEPIELLVAPEHAGQARDLILSLGYRRVYPLTPERESLLLRAGPLPLHNDARSVRFHLDDSAVPECFNLGLNETSLRSRARRLRIGDHEVDALSAEDTLVLACVYGSLHMWAKLAWISDVARLIQREERLDWNQVVELALEAGALRMLRLGLLLAYQLLGAPLPENVLRLAQQDLAARGLAARQTDRFFADVRGHTSQLERLRFRLALAEGLRAKISFCREFGFTAAPDDLTSIRLPAFLSVGYRTVRPVRLGYGMASRLLGKVRRAPYFSTPMPVVERMLQIAHLAPGDVIYDLGCGDGRTVIAAARGFGARGVGVDLDPKRIRESRAAAREAGVAHLVKFIQGDATKVDVSDATVVFLWLLPELNLRLRPRLQAELPPGARIISHSFDMGGWLPDRTELITYDENQVVLAYLWDIKPKALQQKGASNLLGKSCLAALPTPPLQIGDR